MIYSKDQYHEAILQLRPKDERLLEFVKKKIDKKSNVFISKEVENKYGYDLYLNSRRFAWTLANSLKRTFRGTVKKSRKLFTVNRLTSKRVYRVTICFRLSKDL